MVSLGASAAYIYSIVSLIIGGPLYFETAAFILIALVIGKYLEAIAKGRTSDSIAKLLGLQPKTARVIRDDNELDIPISDVLVDDIVVVRPGEKIPVDGTIIEGKTRAVKVSKNIKDYIKKLSSIGSLLSGIAVAVSRMLF